MLAMRRRKLKPKTYELEVESLSHEGRGIAHLDDKVIFVLSISIFIFLIFNLSLLI